MRKTAVNSRFSPVFLLLVFVLFLVPAGFSACMEEPGGSLDEACQKDQDCPNPARQRCVVEWGICVGQTNELGDLDAGTGQ